MSNIPSPDKLTEFFNMKREYEPISEERKKMLEQATSWLERSILETRINEALKRWASLLADAKKFNKPLPKKQAPILTFSGNIKQGVDHKMYAFVRWDPENQKGQWVNERPEKHPDNIWYFGINYLMMGGDVRRIGNRAFSDPSINIKPVITRLRENDDIKLHYVFSLTDRKEADPKTGKMRVTKWFLKIHWEEDRERILEFRNEHKVVANKQKADEKKASPEKKKPSPEKKKPSPDNKSWPALGKPVGKVKVKASGKAKKILVKKPDDYDAGN